MADGYLRAPCRGWTCRSPTPRRCRASPPSAPRTTRRRARAPRPSSTPACCARGSAATAYRPAGSARRSCRGPLGDGMIAAHLVTTAKRRDGGALGAADIGRARAAGMETASGGRADQPRDLAADLAQLAAGAGQAFEQAHGIGMVRPPEEIVERA